MARRRWTIEEDSVLWTESATKVAEVLGRSRKAVLKRRDRVRNPERVNAAQRAYYKNNREKVKRSARLWAQNNPEKRAAIYAEWILRNGARAKDLNRKQKRKRRNAAVEYAALQSLQQIKVKLIGGK